MPLEDKDFVAQYPKYISRIKDIVQEKIDNTNPDTKDAEPYMDGYVVKVDQIYPRSLSSRPMNFKATRSPRGKWMRWQKWFQEANILFGNNLIGKAVLFEDTEMSWGGDRATEVPKPLFIVSEDDLKAFLAKPEVKRGVLDLTEIDFSEMTFEEVVRQTPQAANTSAVATTITAILARSNGSMPYDRLVVDVLTNVEYAGDDALKAVVANKASLVELGFTFGAGDVVMSPGVPF